MDFMRDRLGVRWLSSTYYRLLSASDDARTWGGGGGTWVHGAPGENEHWPYLNLAYDKHKRLKSDYKRISRGIGKIVRRMKGLRARRGQPLIP